MFLQERDLLYPTNFTLFRAEKCFLLFRRFCLRFTFLRYLVFLLCGLVALLHMMSFLAQKLLPIQVNRNLIPLCISRLGRRLHCHLLLLLQLLDRFSFLQSSIQFVLQFTQCRISTSHSPNSTSRFCSSASSSRSFGTGCSVRHHSSHSYDLHAAE